MLVEKVHFEREYISPWQLGWKALAVNISDIAAMGGVPLFALVSMGLAGWVDDAYVEGIYKGMLDIARQFDVKLVGGDTVSSPEAMVLSTAILGSAGFPITRSGAAPGHLIAVTGCLGRSAAGLACLRRLRREDGLIRGYSEDVRPGTQLMGRAGMQWGTQTMMHSEAQEDMRQKGQPRVQSGIQREQKRAYQEKQSRDMPGVQDAQAGLSQSVAERGDASPDLESGAARIDELIKAHLEPVPRVREGRALASSSVVSAMMDISDGLAGDIRHIARESKVGVIIREDAVPIGESTLLAAKVLECNPLEWALSGGEDFELVFTFPPEFADTIRDALSNAGGSMHIVGHITPETEGVVLLGRDGVKRSLAVKGYDHFGGTLVP
jgi:thiamine monophosphate kinase